MIRDFCGRQNAAVQLRAVCPEGGGRSPGAKRQKGTNVMASLNHCGTTQERCINGERSTTRRNRWVPIRLGNGFDNVALINGIKHRERCIDQAISMIAERDDIARGAPDPVMVTA
jgi:hypothetical protein